ncbi:hypothetical protein GCM10007425_11300 [Lysinibacillus alkalisoli]|uniref:Uncharacterized protein n=1 Tax=Lysinibacillus alkalisoli TaxID=1911548 RepID=A0A917LFF2_9BACI|nr:hypothetical protein [Lysinibacillus alkalisoli]GGG18554.1 hypothetical protein GCM10007425_11300 [Lysinibacillus alkalisoli]
MPHVRYFTLLLIGSLLSAYAQHLSEWSIKILPFFSYMHYLTFYTLAGIACFVAIPYVLLRARHRLPTFIVIVYLIIAIFTCLIFSFWSIFVLAMSGS